MAPRHNKGLTVCTMPLIVFILHYGDVIMGATVSQITNLAIVYSTVYSGADQRKHQSSAPLVFVRGIRRWPVNSPHKGSVTRKMFPFDDVIIWLYSPTLDIELPNLLWVQQVVPDVKFVNSGARNRPQLEGIPRREGCMSGLARSITLGIICIHITSIEISSDSMSCSPCEGHMWPLICSPLRSRMIIIVTGLRLHGNRHLFRPFKPEIVT